MPLIHETIPQFFNGVSQQAPNLRRTSQVETQINMFSSIADGVLPRTPSINLGKISSSPLGNVYHHTIDRTEDEQFNVIIKNGSIEVYDMTGTAMTVTYPAGVGYLSAANPKNDFEAITIKDFTFILNKTVTVTKNTITAGTLNGTAQRFSSLKDIAAATSAPVGTVYEIQGDENDTFDSYFVKKIVESSDNDADTWEETVDPTVTSDNFDNSSMPHQLVKTGPTTFELQVVPWVSRSVGSDFSNPFPSFTGSTINDMFLYRDRFAFLSGDSVILSEQGADNYFNFFRTTVTQLLESDPIDVSANITAVIDLLYAVPFDNKLILFSENTQFTMGDSDILTQDTVEIKPTTNFATSPKARPVLAGRNIYFPFERTNYTGFREYFVDSDSLQNDAADITKHVPRYVPKDIFKVVSSSNEDFHMSISTEEQNIFYIYQWYWGQGSNGLSKLQSAWHKWDMGSNTKILNADLIDNVIFIIIEREGEVFLESIDMATRNFDGELPYQVRLDRRDKVTGVYDALTNKTTWTLPYSTSSEIIVVRDDGFTTNKGLQVLGTTQPTTSTVEALGDHSESECFVGIEYYKEMELSPFFVRQSSASGGSIARLGGKLKISKLKLSYDDTSYFEVEVKPKARPSRTRIFNSPIGSVESTIGQATPATGVYSVPILSQGDTTKIKIKSSSFLPFAITSGEWEGFFHSVVR